MVSFEEMLTDLEETRRTSEFIRFLCERGIMHKDERVRDRLVRLDFEAMRKDGARAGDALEELATRYTISKKLAGYIVYCQKK
jgi:hypothetical protein